VIEEKDLQELASFQSENKSALSLYLNTDLTQQPKEQCRLLLKELLGGLGEGAWAADVAHAERFLDYEYDWQARGVVIFSDSEQKLWRTYSLELPIVNAAHTGESLYIRPLVNLMDRFGRYGLILVDREKARFLVAYLGQIEEKGESSGKDLKRHKQGGFSATRFQRQADRQAEQNLRQVAQATVSFCKVWGINRIVLAGSDTTLAEFMGMLPKTLAKLVVGTLPMDVETSATEVMERSAELVGEQRRQHEVVLVDQLVTAAAKGTNAVTGLADAFYVAHQGRARELVVEQDFEAEGYLCNGCGLMSTEPLAKCPSCGGHPQQVRDAVNRLVQMVISSGGTVTTVAGSTNLAEAGHVGALLRY